jgi:tRNA pseudouridine32 synthase/23S rRNA pseudouridine746 synthase
MTSSSRFDLDLVYSDESLLVVNKPAGLLAVPGRGADKQDCLSSRVQQLFPDALVVHRLDMSTSGLMLFARGADLQRRISVMFQEREVNKRYVAIVTGHLETEIGEVDLPIMPTGPGVRCKRSTLSQVSLHSRAIARWVSMEMLPESSLSL